MTCDDDTINLDEISQTISNLCMQGEYNFQRRREVCTPITSQSSVQAPAGTENAVETHLQ